MEDMVSVGTFSTLVPGGHSVNDIVLVDSLLGRCDHPPSGLEWNSHYVAYNSETGFQFCSSASMDMILDKLWS